MKIFKKALRLFSLLCLILSFFIINKATVFSAGISDKLSGKILLQVEENGEAWYVNPANKNRYFLGRPEDAFGVMRELGVGITNNDLAKIAVADKNLYGVDSDGDGLSDMAEDSFGTDKNNQDSDGDGYKDKDEIVAGYNPLGGGELNIDDNFAQKQAGKILLQVEKNGEAWYINPQDNKRYFLGRPNDAFNLMRSVGLGITNSDLNNVPTKGSTPIQNTTENNQTQDTGTNQGNTNTALKTTIPEDEKWIVDVIAAHETKATTLVTLLDKADNAEYLTNVSTYFNKKSLSSAKNTDSDFFEAFHIDTIMSVGDGNISNEIDYYFSSDNKSDEDVNKPYLLIDSNTIRIGHNISMFIPYDLVKEDGEWKMSLDIAEDYFNDYTRLEDEQFESFEGEYEVMLMKKILSALDDYKNKKNVYPTKLIDITAYDPSLKDFLEYATYAYYPSSNPSHYHVGMEIYDENSGLNRDSDVDSINAGYENGFSGEDPVYDFQK